MKSGYSKTIAFFATATALAFAASTGVVRTASAHDDDHKRLQGLKVKIRYDAARPDRARFLFKTKNQNFINDLSADPRTVGATLTIRGTGPTDGDSGVIHLPTGEELGQERWTAIGDKGWQYKYGHDFNDSYGITNVKIKTNASKGGSLIIKGKGQYFDYDIIDGQEIVDISLSIGTEVYCGQVGQNPGEFTRNEGSPEAGKVDGKKTGLPADCTVVCGNGILELGEECDDGNTADNDTCTNECLGCSPQEIEYNSTYEGIQALIFDNPLYNCSNDTCHGATTQSGGLDLRDGFSHGNLVNIPASSGTNGMRVFPGDQDLSYLYNKIAAKTLGQPTNVGTPMPPNANTVSQDLLEALRLWIRGGAPDSGVVVGTAELFGSCLPPAAPLKMPQPDPPVNGAQFAMPGYDLPTESETELCVATFYDLTGQVDPDYIVPCPGAFPGTNPGGDCFAWNRLYLAQDPQSHHSITHIYAGAEDVNHPAWGPWDCYLGDNDGLACDPTDPGACPGGGICGGGLRDTTACVGFGPPDWGFTNNGAPQFVAAQESTFITEYPQDVYSLLPLRGIIGWNSHAFNLTASDMNMEGWLNVDFAASADRTYLGQALFDDDHIFTQDVAPYEQEEYCYTHTFEQGTRLFELTSHMHSGGIRWRYYLPPNNPCANPPGCTPGPLNQCQTPPGCNPGSPSDIFYESTDYSDPVLMLDFFGDDEWVFDSANAADRTLKFCALYDNGMIDPSTVKRASTSQCPQPVCNQFIRGGPCGLAGAPTTDPANQEIFCLDSGLPCTQDSDCPNSVCDACRLKGGTTTGDEMFIALGTYYVVPLGP